MSKSKEHLADMIRGLVKATAERAEGNEEAAAASMAAANAAFSLAAEEKSRSILSPVEEPVAPAETPPVEVVEPVEPDKPTT